MRGYRQYLTLTLLAVFAAILAGCSVLPKPPPAQATYDLGPAPSGYSVTLSDRITLKPVTAPGWMDQTDMLYRLAYADDARVRSYSLSRWVAPPASLVEQRLQSLVQVSTDGKGKALDVAFRLQRFEQVFVSPKIAHVAMKLRVSVRDASGSLVAQRSFSGREPSVTPDAPGGVKALSELSNRVLHRALVWVHGRGWRHHGQSGT